MKKAKGKTAKLDHGNAHVGEAGKDAHASAEHKKHNAKHGMSESFAPSGMKCGGTGENYCSE